MSTRFRFVSLMLAIVMALSVCGFSAAEGYEKVVFSYATFNNIPTNEVRASVEEAINAITREKIGVEVELMPISIWEYSSAVSRGLQGQDKIDVFQTLGDFNVAASTGMALDITMVPEGRKPLIISQRDVSYPLAKQNSAFAKRLVVDAGGNVRCEYVDETGNASMGDYDVIPIVDSFIRDHPDFSYNGARGIIGLTGYNGILGYRTSPYLASAESNPYGAFDVGSETMAMEVVLEVLEKEGWEFASNTFWDMSYGSEYSMVESDVNLWNEQVGALIGGTDLLIYAKGTDIASWAPYSDDDPKYALLKGSGFKYFMVNEKETPGFLQVEDDYMRQAIYDINTYEDFESAVTG